MCVTPYFIPEHGLVGCRNCWRCRNNRVNDLVGRCIAESQYSTATFAVTLTYAGDTPATSTLVYEDFQKFMKRLRFAGYSVRYIVAGEYGSKKGRAHWHCVLFFKGTSPDVPQEERFDWKHWPHGFSYFQRPDYKGFSYVLKYALKEQTKGAVNHLAMSKKPILGWEFIKELAEKHVNQGLSPQSAAYSFRDQFDGKGKRRVFYLQGRARQKFVERYLTAYLDRHGVDYPFSEFLDRHSQNWLPEAREMTDREWLIYNAQQPVPNAQPEERRQAIARTEAIHLAEAKRKLRENREGAALTILPDREMCIELFSDDTYEIQEKGGQKWHVKDEAELKNALSWLDLGQSRIEGLMNQLDARRQSLLQAGSVAKRDAVPLSQCSRATATKIHRL